MKTQLKADIQLAAGHPGATRKSVAFTLIELLVVISIIGLLAALVVGLAKVVGPKKTESTVRTELRQLELVLESYKSKLGFYPPDNANNPPQPPLYYELCGTVAQGNPPEYRPLAGSYPITRAKAQTFFNIQSFMNSGNSVDEVRNFHPQVKANQIDTNSAGITFFVVPADGPANPQNPTKIVSGKTVALNTWRYDSSSTNRHNPESYDLWAELLIGGKTNIIGNWKD